MIAALPRDKRRAVMNALANLARFSGQYDYWHWIARNAGLKYEKRPAIEVALKMLNSNLQDVEDWLVKALQVLPAKHATTLAFIAVTGLRPGEGCASAALISDLAEQGRLTNYYNEKMRMLEHFRFPKLFLRRSKNCYISFVPRSMLDRVMEIRPKTSRIAVIRALDQRGMNARIRDLRHLYATRLRESVPSEVIDLVQGRIGESVFLRYYYEPFLEKIREKVLAVVDPFAEKLLSTFT